MPFSCRAAVVYLYIYLSKYYGKGPFAVRVHVLVGGTTVLCTSRGIAQSIGRPRPLPARQHQTRGRRLARGVRLGPQIFVATDFGREFLFKLLELLRLVKSAWRRANNAAQIVDHGSKRGANLRGEAVNDCVQRALRGGAHFTGSTDGMP